MPIYEYECGRCGRRFEYMQKMSDPPKSKCEACGGKLTRLISPAGFQLKGTGWYKTDYAQKSERKKDDKEKEREKEKTTETSKAVGNPKEAKEKKE
ncbi:MAG TPA: zinc ribbon domain-containing protein [Polyangia bacterium]|nr:zinc ribbon domain-containing protein [Polyangia bacterium]